MESRTVLRRAAMRDRQTAHRPCLTTRDRRILAGAYWPVIAFAASLVTTPTARRRRHRHEAALP
ncbi:hypothetical protein L842_3331 [Mycobacterium intracellulare MIN_052511_1280]|nr:hypothetical protein L842_3331 [Mycobacterium intracellulare MIN_052511_1280]